VEWGEDPRGAKPGPDLSGDSGNLETNCEAPLRLSNFHPGVKPTNSDKFPFEEE
jgi:hypothetical protein